MVVAEHEILTREQSEQEVSTELASAVSGFDVRVGLGGDFLDTSKPVDRTRLDDELHAFISGEKEVDTAPLSALARKEQEKASDSIGWENAVTNWIERYDSQTYIDKVQGLDSLGVKVHEFIALPEQAKKEKVRELGRTFFEDGVKIDKLADAILSSARESDTEPVSMSTVESRLTALDNLLNSCGVAKEAIIGQIRFQGLLRADEHTRDTLLDRAVPQVIDINSLSPQQLTTLSDLHEIDRELHSQPQETPQGPSREAEAVPEWVSNMQVGSESIPGSKSEPNEDEKFVRETERAFGVFDGVGGTTAGEVAAQFVSTATELSLVNFPDALSETFSEEDAKREMAGVLHKTHNELVRKENNDKKSMETTASVVKILDNGLAVIGNVGDSRVYLSRNGHLEPITLDDGLIRSDFPDDEQKALAVQKRVANAKTKEDVPDSDVDCLQPEYKHKLIQTLGQTNRDGSLQSIEPRIYTVQLNPSDILLLTSDGVHDNATDEELEAWVNEHADNPQEAARTIVYKAKEISYMDYPERIGKPEYSGREIKKKHDDGFTAVVIVMGH